MKCDTKPKPQNKRWILMRQILSISRARLFAGLFVVLLAQALYADSYTLQADSQTPHLVPQNPPRPIPQAIIPKNTHDTTAPSALSPQSAQLEATEPLIKLEFIISYKAQSQDGIITGERYSVSDPITLKSQHLTTAYTCKLDTPINNLITDDEAYALKYILSNYKDEVIACLQKGRADVRYDGSFSQNVRVQDSALLHFPPQRILAYFENRYLVIDVLK
ncbi:hypothetical protein [uncultured Helicobacter sp.]|uniref:hypothetical protein n=1 Tax=uncultured Helicobacter sp. TaxID=175537 RepID=UPI0026188A4A|nr:hypothetical protein [uncultured Helicobacter sp.]